MDGRVGRVGRAISSSTGPWRWQVLSRAGKLRPRQKRGAAPQPKYLVFAGSQSRLVQLILAQAVGLGHLRGRLFET